MGAYDGSAPRRWRGAARQTRFPAEELGRLAGSQFKLHSVMSDFPPRLTHGAVFRALLIENRVGVVQMDQNAADILSDSHAFQKTVRSGQGQVAHLASGLSAAEDADELIVRPERAIQKAEIALGRTMPKCLSALRQTRGIEESLFVLHQLESNHRLVLRQTPAKRLADVVRKAAAERHGCAG